MLELQAYRSWLIIMSSIARLSADNIEHAMPITPHANGEPLLLSGAPHIHILPQFATILLVVWSANGDGGALTSKASSKVVNLLNHDTYQ